MAANSRASASGYDCNFLSEPPDDLRCLICLCVARDPRQHEECGKLFCSECIEKYGTDQPCPNCKKTGVQFYKDHRGKRNIAELQVKCDNADRGCEWVGTVGTLQEHVDLCQLTLLPCPNQCTDDNYKVQCFLRRELDKHLTEDCPRREYTCEYCGEKWTYAAITGIHDFMCQKKPVPCPNDGCTATMQHQAVGLHLAVECEHIVVPCKYKNIGCKAEMKRRDITAHEDKNEALHLQMAMETINLREKHSNGEILKFKFTDYQRRRENRELVLSPSYYTSPNGYLMALEVYVSAQSFVSVYAHILNGRYDTELKWPLAGKITFILMNQPEDKNHHCKCIQLTESLPGSTAGYNCFIPHSELSYDWVLNTQYLKDDTLYFRMSVEVADHKSWLE